MRLGWLRADRQARNLHRHADDVFDLDAIARLEIVDDRFGPDPRHRDLAVRILDRREEHVERHLAMDADRLDALQNSVFRSLEHLVSNLSTTEPLRTGATSYSGVMFGSPRGGPPSSVASNGRRSGSARSRSSQRLCTLTPSSRTGRRPPSVRSSNCTALATSDASSRLGGAVWLRVTVVKSE